MLNNVRNFTSKLPTRLPIAGVDKILLVASGKGGVGKSTVAVNLAVGIQNLNKNLTVGLLDADIYGPSLPLLMNLTGPVKTDKQNMMIPLLNYNIKCMSMGFLSENESQPVVWRGPIVMNAIQQLLRKVRWGPLDLLVIDMPPGTGDVLLSLSQNIPVQGAVLVSSPQEVALMDVKKTATAFKQLQIPTLGLIENMAFHECSKCGTIDFVFGSQGPRALAQKLGIKLLGSIPLSTPLSQLSDQGSPVIVADPNSKQTEYFLDISKLIMEKMDLKNI